MMYGRFIFPGMAMLGLVVMISHPGAAADSAAGALLPTALRCEYRTNPQGIGETRPRLGWKLEAREAGARSLAQSSYQILVASELEALTEDAADLWNSGRIESAQANNIDYAGRALRSRDRCWWKVRVWDQAGRASDWSAPGEWSMGLLAESDWRAEWIGLDASPPTDGSAVSPEQDARLRSLAWVRSDRPEAWLRREIEVPEDRVLQKATIVLVPDGQAAITVNGRPVGEASRWEQTRPIDLTGALHIGRNRMELHLRQGDDNPAAVLGEVELVFAAGDPMRMPVDTSWIHSTVRPEDGWDMVRAEPGAWKPVAAISENKTPWETPQNATRFLPPAAYLRREFRATGAVRRATLYATALGLYEIHLNGTRVGEDVLTPGWTDYRKRVPAQTYDVTALLRQGDNAIGALLGDGWFAGTLAHVGPRHYGGYPRFRAQLELEFADGRRETIVTGGAWRASHGAVRHADIFQGSAIDYRLGWATWAEPGFDDAGWPAPQQGLRSAGPGNDPPSAPFVEPASITPPRVTEELSAREVKRTGAGKFIVDFGQNLVGWVRLSVVGRPGQRVMVRHGEMLNPDGSLYTSNLRGAAATDTYWLKGGDKERLEPVFTFHGFRYAEISGLDTTPAPGDIVARVVGSPLDRTGAFDCADPRLNQLFHNIVWGQRGNYLEVPTDCPQRDERLGWTGDTQFFIRTAAYNYDVAAFIERWLTTLVTDSQWPDGTFPSFVPALEEKPWPSTGWGDAAILCTHALWEVYADRRVIERHFDALLRYLEFVDQRAPGGVAKIGGFGDWLHLGGTAPAPLIDTAYYAHLCALMSKMAAAIGRDAEAERLARQAATVRSAFAREFVQPDGSLKESGQTGYALGFTMDLVPEGRRAAMADRFVEAIAVHNWHLATGFIGTPRLLPALHAAGRDDIAHRLLRQDTYPSWLYQVGLGATTMWERWDGWSPERGFQTRGMNSFNHYAFGAVGEYLYRTVAGIEPAAPGFARITIAPVPMLDAAEATYDSIAGRVVTKWRRENGRLRLDVDIPPNATATIHIPASSPDDVREGGQSRANLPPLRPIAHRDGEAIFEVGSGRYQFESTIPAEESQ